MDDNTCGFQHLKGPALRTPPTGKPVVLVVTSTLPRRTGDTEPRFVLDLCRALAAKHRVIALAPHCAGAAPGR
jgi:hypothetical protein